MRVYLIGLVVFNLCMGGALSAAAKSKSKQAARARPVSQESRTAAPVAVIVEIEGKPVVVRGRKTLNVSVGDTLLAGDVVKTPADRDFRKSCVAFFYRDARKVVVGPGKTFTITPPATSESNSDERWKKLLALILPTLKSQRYAVPGAPAVRGTPDSIPPLDPVQPKEFTDEDGTRVTGKMLSNAPVFIFTALPKAKVYRIRITSMGDMIVDRTLTEQELHDDSENSGIIVAEPQGLELPAGTLRWQIIAGNSESDRTRLIAFRSIDPAQDSILQQGLKDLPEGVAANIQLIRAAAFESLQLFGNAVDCYHRAIHQDPNEALYRRLLARLYDRMELYVLADYQLSLIRGAPPSVSASLSDK